MTKRILCTILTIAAASGRAGAADTPRIKVATILPRGTSAHQALLEMTAKWQKAGITPSLFTDATQGGEAEIVKRMRIDQLQAAVLSVAGLIDIDRSAAALQLMPGAFRSLDEVSYVRERLRPLLDKRMEEKGFVSLAWADAGWVQIFSVRRGSRPDDFRKMKIFTEGSDRRSADLMKAAGFPAVPMEYTDVLTGLQTGLIDAVPITPFYALAGQFYRPARYMLELNYSPLVGAVVMTKKGWDRLPAEGRDAVRRSAEDAARKITMESRREMTEAVAAMQKRGMTISKPTKAEEAEWKSLYETLYPRIRGDMVPADLFDEVMRLLAEYRK